MEEIVNNTLNPLMGAAWGGCGRQWGVVVAVCWWAVVGCGVVLWWWVGGGGVPSIQSLTTRIGVVRVVVRSVWVVRSVSVRVVRGREGGGQ